MGVRNLDILHEGSCEHEWTYIMADGVPIRLFCSLCGVEGDVSDGQD